MKKLIVLFGLAILLSECGNNKSVYSYKEEAERIAAFSNLTEEERQKDIQENPQSDVYAGVVMALLDLTLEDGNSVLNNLKELLSTGNTVESSLTYADIINEDEITMTVNKKATNIGIIIPLLLLKEELSTDSDKEMITKIYEKVTSRVKDHFEEKYNTVVSVKVEVRDANNKIIKQ